MGTVWLAHHARLDVPCAVKFLHPDLAERPELLARFEREAKAAAQIKSPHVVEILDYGTFDGSPYIAMELLVGEDLRRRIGKRGRLSPSETRVVVEQVGRALEKAHARGIVHRDLKPENVFLVSDGDREIVKVLDFGIAKDSGSQLKLTSKGMVLGTPMYMSPEQIMGKLDVDHRADLWSLAIVAFECLTGKPPMEEGAFADMAAKIAFGELPRPSTLVPDLPRSVDAWFAKATRKEREGRHQTAREMVEDLCAALDPRASAPEIAAEVRLAEVAYPRLPAPPLLPRVSAPEAVTLAQVPSRGSLSDAVWSGAPPSRGHRRSYLVAGAVLGSACLVLAAAAVKQWVLPTSKASPAHAASVPVVVEAPAASEAAPTASLSAPPSPTTAPTAKAQATSSEPRAPARRAPPKAGAQRARSGS